MLQKMELQHPGKILQEIVTARGLTQKTFATMMGKKVSEINELIKGKRNITVQWDILISLILGDPEKKWLNLQNNFDYVVAKVAMADKIQEIKSKTKKSKEHEVFEDF